MIGRLHFKSLKKNDHSSAIDDQVTATGHNIKLDHFEILASGKTDYHCKIKETLFIQDLILLHEKLLQFDWLRAVVFQLNL